MSVSNWYNTSAIQRSDNQLCYVIPTSIFLSLCGRKNQEWALSLAVIVPGLTESPSPPNSAHRKSRPIQTQPLVNPSKNPK